MRIFLSSLLLLILVVGVAKFHYTNEAVAISGRTVLPHWKEFQEKKTAMAENPPEEYQPLASFRYNWNDRGLYCHAKSALGLAWVPGLSAWVYTQYGEVYFRPFADNGMTDVWVTGNVFCTSSPFQIFVWQLTKNVVAHPLNQ
jgi:hypothetical protein